MSADQNTNNYRGVTTTIVGYAASDARNPAYDKEGTRGVKQVPIAVNEGYKKDGEFVQTGTTWYRVEKHQDDWATLGVQKGDAAQALLAVRKGDLIRVDDAKQEVRAYKAGDGTEKLGITLKFGQVTVLESKSGGDSDQPF